MFDYLAEFVFERHVSSTGVVSLGRRLHSVGRRHAGKTVHVHCDSQTHEWVCCEKVKENDQEIKYESSRRPVKGIDGQSLTGLQLQALTLAQPVQLTLPGLAP